MNCLKCGIEWPLTTKKKEKQKCDCGQKLSDNCNSEKTEDKFEVNKKMYVYWDECFSTMFVLKENKYSVELWDGEYIYDKLEVSKNGLNSTKLIPTKTKQPRIFNNEDSAVTASEASEYIVLKSLLKAFKEDKQPKYSKEFIYCLTELGEIYFDKNVKIKKSNEADFRSMFYLGLKRLYYEAEMCDTDLNEFFDNSDDFEYLYSFHDKIVFEFSLREFDIEESYIECAFSDFLMRASILQQPTKD